MMMKSHSDIEEIAAEAWDKIRVLTGMGNGKTDDFITIIKSACKKAVEHTDAANCSLLALAAVVKGHPETPESLKRIASKELLDHSRGAYLIEELRKFRAAHASEQGAESLSSMVIEYVERGIKGGTDWRNGLREVIQLRLNRLSQRPTPASDTVVTDGLGSMGKINRKPETVSDHEIWKQANIVCALSGAVAHDCDHHGITRPTWWKAVKKLQKLVNQRPTPESEGKDAR